MDTSYSKRTFIGFGASGFRISIPGFDRKFWVPGLEFGVITRERDHTFSACHVSPASALAFFFQEAAFDQFFDGFLGGRCCASAHFSHAAFSNWEYVELVWPVGRQQDGYDLESGRRQHQPSRVLQPMIINARVRAIMATAGIGWLRHRIAPTARAYPVPFSIKARISSTRQTVTRAPSF